MTFVGFAAPVERHSPGELPVEEKEEVKIEPMREERRKVWMPPDVLISVNDVLISVDDILKTEKIMTAGRARGTGGGEGD